MKLTAVVLDRTANSVLEDGATTADLQHTLLHDARGVVADAVAEFAGEGGISGNLSIKYVRQYSECDSVIVLPDHHPGFVIHR